MCESQIWSNWIFNTFIATNLQKSEKRFNIFILLIG